MGGLSSIGNMAGGLMLPGFPGTSTDPAKLFSSGGGGGGGGSSYPAASFAPSQTGQLTAYQPNYETFYNPLAMLQAGQPSFSDPAWYTSMLGPAQQQNMMAAVPQQAAPPPISQSIQDVNPWSNSPWPIGPGGLITPDSTRPGMFVGSPEFLSNIQHDYTGRYPSPWAMQLMMQGRENSG